MPFIAQHNGLSCAITVAIVLVGLFVDARLSPFTACTRCSGPTFEAKQCMGREDSECLHISRPFFDTTISFKDYQTMEDRYGFEVKHSNNIFLEDLLRTHTLTHSIRVGNRHQTNTFPWIRKSGLKIWVTLKDINLLPEYEDIEYESDNKFIYEKDEKNETMNVVQKIMKNYCRHPVPDSYSVFLFVHTSRTTAIERISCVKRDKSQIGVVQCPDDYTEHDIYAYRTVNKKCRKVLSVATVVLSQGAHLPSNPNSFLCTQNTPLLTQIFNKTIREEFLSFPTDKRCIESSFQCNHCINDSSSCKRTTSSVHGFQGHSRDCCGIHCFSSQWCKNYYREECIGLPNECATGDTMRFTLYPIFQNIQNGTFMCHLRYKPPKRLYRLSYNVTILDKNHQPLWVSHPISKDVTADGRAELHEDRTVQLDNIGVKHMTLMRLYPELLIKGNKGKSNSDYHFTAFQLKDPHDFENGKIEVIKPNPNGRAYIADIQVTRPFDVSTSSWINHWCYVNVSKLHKKQPIYKSGGINVEAEIFREKYDPNKLIFDPLTKERQNAPPPPIQYFLRRKKFRPEIRFEMKDGSESILKPHFCRQHPYNRINRLADLETSLLIQAENRWNITLHGFVNATPAYFHVRLTEARSRALIISHDVAVLGRNYKFFLNFSFLLPPVGGRRDVDFELALEDCIRTRRIFLASFEQRQLSSRRKLYQSKGEIAAPEDLEQTMYPSEVTPMTSTESIVGSSEDQEQPYFVLLLLTLAVGAIYLLLLVVYGILRFCRRPHRYSHEELFPNLHHHHHHHHHNRVTGDNSETSHSDQQQQPPPPPTRASGVERARRHATSLSTRRKVILMTYLVFRVFYNFLFTFSAITSVIFSLQSVAMTTLESASTHQSALRDRFRVQFDNLEAYSSREMKRQVDFAQSLSSACNHLIGSTLGNTTMAMRRMSQTNLDTMLLKGRYSIANQTRKRFRRTLVKYQQDLERFLDKHKHRMVNNLKVNYAPYGSLLRKVYVTPWLKFPQELFNKSKSFIDSLFDYALRPSTLKKVHVDFLTFLGISEAEDLHLMQTKLWKSLDSALPKLPNELPPYVSSGKLPLWRSLKERAERQILPESHSQRFFSTPDDQPLRLSADIQYVETEPSNKEESPPHSKEITFDARIISIRLYLFVLDLLIVLYRFYHTYRTARVLYTGRRVRLTEAELVSITHSNSATSFASSVNTLLTSRESTPTAAANQHAQCNLHLGVNPQLDPTGTLTSTASTPGNTLSGMTAGLPTPAEGNEDAGVNCLTSLRRSCFFTVHYLAVVVTAGLALLTLFCLIHTDRTLHVPTVLHRGGFLRRLDTLEASRRLVNEILQTQAKHLNVYFVQDLKQQSDEMIRRLKSLQYRYQHEQLHLSHLYHSESCSIDRQHCESSPRLLHNVDSPVPSCNIVKIPGHNFSEFMNPFSILNYGYFRDYQQIRRSLLADGSVMPEVGALRNLLFTSVVVLFTALAAIGVLHLLGGLCLRWTRLPLRPTRLTKQRPSSITTVTSANPGHSQTDASPLLRPHQPGSAPAAIATGQTSLTQESRV